MKNTINASVSSSRRFILSFCLNALGLNSSCAKIKTKQFELTQLRSYRTTLVAAARLFNEFGLPRSGNMRNGGVRSVAGGDSADSELNFMNENEFPSLSTTASYKQSKRRTRVDLSTSSEQKPEEVRNIGPLQHEAAKAMTCSKQPLEADNTPLQRDCYETDFSFWEKKHSSSSRNEKGINRKFRQTNEEHREEWRRSKPSASVSDLYETDLPTTFGKKHVSSSRNQKFLQTHQARRGRWIRSKPSSSTPIDEPLDISLPQESTVEESGLVLRPGMVLFKNYIPLMEQVNIVRKCRELGRGAGGFYRPGYKDGAKLRLYMMCLGLDWDPQTKKYGMRRSHDNAEPPDLPCEFTSLVSKVLDDSHALIGRNSKLGSAEDVLPTMIPDLCIVNFYTTNGRLGLHQDRDESRESLEDGLPVVSVSIGDSAEFLYGDDRDVDKAESVLLESGDVLIFGGESRMIFHGVKSVISDSAPRALLETTRLRPGRLNLTFRQY